MPIECVWFDEPPPGPWQPGWCFPDPYRIELSKRIVAEIASGARAFPIAVCTTMRGDTAWETGHPGEHRGSWFGIDCHPTDEPEGTWTVTIEGPLVAGEKPDITVAPSMNAVGIYHGYLQHGVLTDDTG